MNVAHRELEILQLSFDIASTQLWRQKDDLQSIRNQASIAAATNGLIATVFATLFSAKNDGLLQVSAVFQSTPFWVMLTLFSLSLFFSSVVMVAWRTCTFDLNSKWICSQAEAGSQKSQVLQDLSVAANGFFDDNEKVIQKVKRDLLASLVFCFLQIPAWLWLLLF